MADPVNNLHLLIEKHLDLLQQRVSICVSSSDPNNMPALARALGCKLSPDRRRITLYVSTSRSEALLDCVRARRTLAVVFNRPSTHESMQLKGGAAEIVPIDATDRACMDAYLKSFIADLTVMDYSEQFVRAVIVPPTDDVVAVAFTPDAAFVATPGANAGQRLKA